MLVLPSCHEDRCFTALTISYNILINGDIMSYNLDVNPFRQWWSSPLWHTGIKSMLEFEKRYDWKMKWWKQLEKCRLFTSRMDHTQTDAVRLWCLANEYQRVWTKAAVLEMDACSPGEWLSALSKTASVFLHVGHWTLGWPSAQRLFTCRGMPSYESPNLLEAARLVARATCTHKHASVRIRIVLGASGSACAKGTLVWERRLVFTQPNRECCSLSLLR